MTEPRVVRPVDWLLVIARVVLGGTFVLLAARKLQDPVAFLKAVREYHLVADGRVLTMIAAVLPWAELTWGAFLIAGVFLRGTAIVVLVSLLVFSGAILSRGLALHASVGGAFCAVGFDCGCGNGVEKVCVKLAENVGLIVLATLLATVPTNFLRVSAGRSS